MRKLRRLTFLSSALIATTALAGCGARSHPGDRYAGVMGTNARVGAVQILSVHVDAPSDATYAAGADAVVWLTLRNGAHRTDTLTSVSSPAAGKTEIRWDNDCDGRYTTVSRLVLRPAVPTGDPSPSAVPTFDAYRLRLVDLQRRVPAGTTVPITFRFDHAGTVTVDVPVQPGVPRGEPSARCVPQPAESARPGA